MEILEPVYNILVIIVEANIIIGNVPNKTKAKWYPFTKPIINPLANKESENVKDPHFSPYMQFLLKFCFIKNKHNEIT